jgi:hypothetical protein
MSYNNLIMFKKKREQYYPKLNRFICFLGLKALYFNELKVSCASNHLCILRKIVVFSQLCERQNDYLTNIASNWWNLRPYFIYLLCFVRTWADRIPGSDFVSVIWDATDIGLCHFGLVT